MERRALSPAFWMACETSRALPAPMPTRPSPSPTATTAEKRRTRPPFTTFITRLIAMVSSFKFGWSSRSPSRSRPRPPRSRSRSPPRSRSRPPPPRPPPPRSSRRAGRPVRCSVDGTDSPAAGAFAESGACAEAGAFAAAGACAESGAFAGAETAAAGAAASGVGFLDAGVVGSGMGEVPPAVRIGARLRGRRRPGLSRAHGICVRRGQKPLWQFRRRRLFARHAVRFHGRRRCPSA